MPPRLPDFGSPPTSPDGRPLHSPRRRTRSPAPQLPPMPSLQPAYALPPLPTLPQYTPPLPPSPSLAHSAMHKVWILDCNNCGAFLTNRAMKAVLLLRPNVPLYSTDALPVNCSAFSSEDAQPASPSAKHSASARAQSDSPRTCECLTQTLCCHTCGSPVGYMIVSPCARCTSSITQTPFPPLSPSTSMPRSTNGHRFVFHSSEVRAEERLYVPGESGVITDVDMFLPPLASPTFRHEFTPVVNTQPASPSFRTYSRSQIPPSYSGSQNAYDYAPTPEDLSVDMPGSPTLLRDRERQNDLALFAHARDTIEQARRLLVHVGNNLTARAYAADSPRSAPNSSSSRSYPLAYLPPPPSLPPQSPFPYPAPPPPQNYAYEAPAVTNHASTSFSASTHPFPPANATASPGSADPALIPDTPSAYAYSSSYNYSYGNGYPDDPEKLRARYGLAAGDVLFWHHLVRRGELPAVRDNDRSRATRKGRPRRPVSVMRGGPQDDSDDEDEDMMRGR